MNNVLHPAFAATNALFGLTAPKLWIWVGVVGRENLEIYFWKGVCQIGAQKILGRVQYFFYPIQCVDFETMPKYIVLKGS